MPSKSRVRRIQRPHQGLTYRIQKGYKLDGNPNVPPTVKPYHDSLTDNEKKIFETFMRLKEAQCIQINKNDIAQEIGCSTKTVQRATNKFMNDGLILKFQEVKRDVNYFMLNPILYNPKILAHLSFSL